MRRLFAVLVLAGCCAAAPVVAAEVFPQRPLRLVISVPPGGAADFTGRVVAAKLSDLLGQNVVVEGRPGAGGIIASEYVTKATPDGYTLMLSSSTTHGAAPVLYKRLLTDRNTRWAKWIDGRLKQPGTVFVAVGAGHLAGRDSVQAQLRKRGIKARRLWE